jgi:hypothetical protein
MMISLLVDLYFASRIFLYLQINFQVRPSYASRIEMQITLQQIRHAVARLVEELCYKSEGRGFESRRDYWIFFNLPNPSSSTMALGFTQPVTELSTRKYFWGKARPARKAANLTAICEPIV